MKKIISIVIMLMLMLSGRNVVKADMGAPEFEDWFVVVTVPGYTYNGKTYEPGTRFMVYYHFGDSYDLEGIDENNKMVRGNHLEVSESDFDIYFIDDKVLVPQEKGNDTSKEVTCTVNAKGGLRMRYGPGKGFTNIVTIPDKTELKYQYTYQNGGFTWGFVQYSGKSGWCAIDYTDKISEKEISQPADPQNDPDSGTEQPAGNDLGTENTQKTADTNTSIVAVAIISAAAAVAGTLGLMTLKKKKEQNNS